jgi:hypothetical protein
MRVSARWRINERFRARGTKSQVLMPTRAILDELIVPPEMTNLACLGAFADFTVLGGPYNSRLVKRLGQRFESARRLSFLPAKSAKTKSSRCSCRGLSQHYVCSRLYPNASSMLCWRRAFPWWLSSASSDQESWLCWRGPEDAQDAEPVSGERGALEKQGGTRVPEVVPANIAKPCALEKQGLEVPVDDVQGVHHRADRGGTRDHYPAN